MTDVNTIPSELIITGELNFSTSPSLYRKGCHLIAANTITTFDLQHVSTSDNSGTALLVAWTRYAKILGKTIKFIHPTSQLLSMLKLTELQKLLPIENG